jgi:hypothetical protein
LGLGWLAIRPSSNCKDSLHVPRLAKFAREKIQTFAVQHTDETFYGFSIDASLLCLNSVEAFAATLTEYQAKFPGSYQTAEQIDELRRETGDWAYQGFSEFTDEVGFDEYAYSEHYDLGLAGDTDDLLTSAYGRAMDSVLDMLMRDNAFACLKRTDDFFVSRVEHNY